MSTTMQSKREHGHCVCSGAVHRLDLLGSPGAWLHNDRRLAGHAVQLGPVIIDRRPDGVR